MVYPSPSSTIHSVQSPYPQVGELSLQRFATTEAVQWTEVWEFVQTSVTFKPMMPVCDKYDFPDQIQIRIYFV